MKVSDMFQKKIVDPNAETVKEISDKTLMCTTKTKEMVLNLVAEGKIEQVWKRVGIRLTPAYRSVKKKGAK